MIRPLFLRSLLALALTAAACGDSTVETSAPPPTGQAAEPAFPVTVAGDAGPLTIDARPERIVSLSATHTEMLYAIGAANQVAGTDLTSNHPAAATETPKVDSFNFNVEEVAALDPDLVILAFDFGGELDALAAAGIPALLLGPAGVLEDSYSQLETLGAATGHEAAAADLVVSLRSQIDEVFEELAAPTGSTIYHEIDAMLFSATSGTFIGDIYSRFGLTNIADEAPDEFGSGFPQLSEEFILESDPDFIFLADVEFGESAETVAARPGWDTLTAVAEGHLVELNGEIAGRWGPRTVDLVRQIGAAVDNGP